MQSFGSLKQEFQSDACRADVRIWKSKNWPVAWNYWDQNKVVEADFEIQLELERVEPFWIIQMIRCSIKAHVVI